MIQYNQEMIAATLRQELELANYKLPAKKIKELIREHWALLGDVDISSREVWYDANELLINFQRLVVGAHGPYIEFRKHELCVDLVCPRDQEWRKSSKYNVKYLWLHPAGIPELKIYRQIKEVNYADYRPGLYYVDYYAVYLVEKTDQQILGEEK